MSKPMHIDVEAILASKAGKKARYVPRFVISYLKKIIHQDEVNGFLDLYGDKMDYDFVDAFMKFFKNSFEVHGLENLPKDGRRFTFVSNHPLGAQDGLGLAYILSPQYEGKIKFLVNDLLMNLPQISSFWIPVNKTGSQARNFPQQVNAAFESDNHIVLFAQDKGCDKGSGMEKDIHSKKCQYTARHHSYSFRR